MTTFDKQWKKYPNEQHDTTETVNTLSTRCQLTENNTKGKTIVEFGCGSGRFIKILGGYNTAMVVGIDIGNSVSIAKRSVSHLDNTHIVRADIHHSPFKPKSFDIGFTMGVLHHTASISKGIYELCRVVKSKGKVSVCVYADGSFYAFPSVYWVRCLVNLIRNFVNESAAHILAAWYAKLSSVLTYHAFKLIKKVPVIGIKIAGAVAYLFAVVSLDKNRRTRELVVYDAITPEIATTHTPEDVEFLMQTFGCKGIVNTAGKLKYSGAEGTAFVAERC